MTHEPYDGEDTSQDDDLNFAAMFGNVLNKLVNDPQFRATGVMADSLGDALHQMAPHQYQTISKLINQFAAALDNAGMLVIPKESDDED